MASYLLQEDGVSKIILEDGSGFLLLEDGPPIGPPIVQQATVVIIESGYDYR